jgi:hypothetical protein
LIFEQINIFLSSAQTVSSSRDFGVEQFFRADEFRAVDPSPNKTEHKPTKDNLLGILGNKKEKGSFKKYVFK